MRDTKLKTLAYRRILFVLLAGVTANLSASENGKLVELGRQIFNDTSLSRDGKISCNSCHDAAHAYADPHQRSIGVDGKVGTRNAPSLIGIGADTSFTWDGRRTRLEDVVVDPFTNPVEFGLSSTDEVVQRLRKEPGRVEAFRAAFPHAREYPTIEQVAVSLGNFVRSLNAKDNARNQIQLDRVPVQVQLGARLFDGVAGCNVCHTHSEASARFADGKYHHSGVGDATQSKQLPELVQVVLQQNLPASAIGPKVLGDAEWSALGRFVVSHSPVDIGAFRTPSLRNVAVTAPYMHDGSIATLAEAVDHEIYYRGFSSGHPINLTQAERQAIVSFLETLVDRDYAAKFSAP